MEKSEADAAPSPEDHGHWWYDTWFEHGTTRSSRFWRTLARRATCVISVGITLVVAVYLAAGFAWLVQHDLAAIQSR